MEDRIPGTWGSSMEDRIRGTWRSCMGSKSQARGGAVWRTESQAPGGAAWRTESQAPGGAACRNTSATVVCYQNHPWQRFLFVVSQTNSGYYSTSAKVTNTIIFTHRCSTLLNSGSRCLLLPCHQGNCSDREGRTGRSGGGRWYGESDAEGQSQSKT